MNGRGPSATNQAETSKCGAEGNIAEQSSSQNVAAMEVDITPEQLGILYGLPLEVIFHIAHEGSDIAPQPPQLMARLACCNHTLNSFFKPDLVELLKQYIEKLLSHVALGEKAEADAMLKKNPELLYLEGITKDHAGRTLKGTAYRIALGAKDVSLDPKEYEEMVEMIASHFKKLADGEAEMARQRAAQFPEGWELEEEKRKHADSAALKKVFAAIEKSNSDTEARAGIDEFKAYLAKQKEGVISTGFHFNDQLFAEALKLYDTHFGQFDDWGSNRKIRLAAIEVIGTIESYFPACLAQAACDGFGSVVENKWPLSRLLVFGYPRKNRSFFHPDLGKSDFINSDFEVQVFFVKAGQASTWPWRMMRVWFIQNLCRAKTANLEALCSANRAAVARGPGVQFNRVGS